MQQERLRALGQMASGIAHDINNAISPVSLYTESLLEREPNLSERARELPDDDPARDGRRGATVARMREFYRQREPQLELARIDVNRIVEQVHRADARALERHAAAARRRRRPAARSWQPELPQIMGAESEIRDALTNLIFNAVDAMPEGGTLTLRTRRSVEAREDGRTDSADVCIEVSRHRRRHGRGDAPPLPRAVLHHQGRARHGARPRDGLRHGAAAQRRDRNRQRARQGHARSG